MTIFITKAGRLYSPSSETELLKFAMQMGLKKSWMRTDSDHSYFTLETSKKIQQAIRHGAIWEIPQEPIKVKCETPQVILKGSDAKKSKHIIRTNYKRTINTRQGKWLSGLRAEFRLQQAEMAELCDLSAFIISDIENGRTKVTEEHAFKIATGMGLPKEEVLKYVGLDLIGHRETVIKAEVVPVVTVQPQVIEYQGGIRLDDYSDDELERELERRRKSKEIVEKLRKRLMSITIMKQRIEAEEASIRRELARHT